MSLLTSLSRDIDTLSRTTDNMLALLDAYSLERANHIPKGFNNNLLWNAGHSFVTQVLLTEGLGGLGLSGLDADFVATYRKGGAPDRAASAEEYAQIKAYLAGGPERLRLVLAEADWSNYKVYETSYGKELQSIEDGVRFNNVHEGMHYGVMLAMRRLV